jgi:hypothetical protein
MSRMPIEMIRARALNQFEDTWRKHRDMKCLLDAMDLCQEAQWPQPDWLNNAMIEFLERINQR